MGKILKNISILSFFIILHIMLNKLYNKTKKILNKILSKNWDISKMITFSTAHISQKEMNLFTDRPKETAYTVILNDEYGVIIYIGDPDEDTEKLKNHTSEFAELVKIARKNDCDYLRLDRDGEVYSNLKIFNW